MRDKFILLMYNQVRFDSSHTGEESVIKESRLKWYSVNTQTQQTFPMQVSTTELFLQDQNIDLDDLTEFSSLEIFTLKDMIPRSYEKDYYTQVDITVEMNLDQEVIARESYNILDLFSDIGGI